MAFLFKVFSGSERLREKQKSAVVVNATFKAELKDIQTKLEVENYELQMLVEMIYDSSFPESQKFLKDPSLDRLNGHKETISSLLFGLAAQGIPVAPLILAHFQKYGCEAIGDTLMKLLELVRPLLASKDVPEFTSDDILDAIDNHWHSSVRSSPAFGSVKGSRAQSPLNSPRHSFSLLSPRVSVSSPQSPFSIDYVVGSNSGPLSPHGFVSPRNSRSFSIPPTVAKQVAGTSHDRFIATPPRRSLSSQYPDMGSLGERLQTLAEHDDETNGNLGRSMRKHDEDSAEPSSKDGANSWTRKADEGDAPSKTEPESSSIVRQGDVNDHTAVKNVNDFSSLSLNGRTGENNKVLTINIPRSALSYEFNELDELEKAGRAQVVDDSGKIIGDVRAKKASETTAGFLPTGSRSDSFSSRLGSDDSRPDGPRPVASREHFDKSVQDLNARAPPQVGENKDISRDKLGSDASSPESLSLRNLGSQIPEEAVSIPSPIARSHVDDLERRVPESITKEVNSADDQSTLEEGIKEDNLHPSKDRVDDIKTEVLATSHSAKEMQLQAASAEHDECKEVQEAKVSEPPFSTSDDLSGPSRDEEISAAVIDSSSTNEVKDKIVETPALDTSVDGYEHGVSGSIEEYRSQTTQDEVEQPVITDSSQAKNEELLPQVEAKELELPVVANPDSRVISDVDGESHGLKLVGEGGDQHEASGNAHDSTERVDEMGSDGANRGAEDRVEYEVSPIVDEEAAVTLSPVRVLDNQMVRSDNESFPTGTVHSDESRNSSVEECRGDDSVVIGGSPSEYRSQTTQGEVEQPVITDSSQAENEDHLPQVEAEKPELPIVANPDSRVISDVDGESYGLKLVGEGGDQHEASRALHDSIERVNETDFDGVNRGIKDMVEYGVSSDTDDEAAVTLSPVRVLDSQMVHSNNDIPPRIKTHSDDSRNSSIEEIMSADSGVIEVSSSKEYRSETTEDEVEQPVISDKAENEDHVPHVEAEKHDPLVVTHAASLTGEYSREGSPFEDLVEKEIITSSPVKEKEVIAGGRNEIYPVRELDIQMVHSDNESQTTQDEVEQPVISDSPKAEKEVDVPHVEAKKLEMPSFVNVGSRTISDVDGESYGLKLVSEGGDEDEASGTTHQSVERVNEVAFDTVDRGIEDAIEDGVSPNVDEEAVVILSPVEVVDIQTVHIDNESSPSSKAQSDDSRNSSIEENRSSDSGINEVSSPKEHHSQTTEDEVEQPVRNDSYKAENEDPVPHEMPITNTPLANGARSFKNAEAEKSALGELPVPLEGVAIVEPGTSSELEQSRLLAAEGVEHNGNERPAECIVTAMDITAGTTKALLKDSNGEKDGVIDCIEGNDDEDKRLSSASSELHSPSYNSVTFDLTKLSTDNNEDTSSCFSLQSQDDDLPVVTNEQVVRRKSSSCDWLDMISVNYLMGSGSNSPSTSAARMSTVSSGISLHSFSFQRDHEDETADHTTPDADVAPDSAGSQSTPTLYLDAGPSANHLLDSERAEKSSVENTEGAGVTDFVTLHSDHESDEGDSLGVTHAASPTGEDNRKGSPSEDLVQDEMITSSPVSEKVIDTEVITGGRNETYAVKELDIQMVHSDNESSPSTKVQSDNSRSSFIEENRGSESGFIEGNPSEYRSQTTEDEVEQSVISDSSKVEKEDHLPHVESTKHEVAIFANPDSGVISDIDGEFYSPKLVREGGDQHEASGSAHDSTERVNEMGSGRVNLGVEDTADYGVSPDVDKEDAVLAHDKEGGALNSQDLADTISEEDQIGAIEDVSKSSGSEVLPIYTGENDAQENAIPGTSSLNLLSTGHREGGHSPVDGVDEVVDSEFQDQVSKLAASNVVQDEEKVGVSGNEMGESDPGTDVNMQVSTLSVASSEPAVVESQNSEDSGRENVLHSPEQAHSLLSDVKEVDITGANYPTPSNIHDGSMLPPVEYGHDERNHGHKKQSEGNEAEVSSSSKEVEGQALMHNLDEVDSKLMEMPLHEIVEKNSALTISESLRSREHETSSFIEHVDEDREASSEVLKPSGGDASTSGGFPFEDTSVSSNRNPPYQDLHPVNGSFQKFLPESVSSEKEERLPVAMALDEAASRNTPLKDEEASAEVRGTQTAQVLDTEEAHECDTGNERKLPPLEKEVDTFVNTTKPAITGKTEPIRSALHKLMEYEKRDSDASSADGPIENMNILDSRGNMARPRSEFSPTPVAKFSTIITDGHSANGVDTRKNHQYHDEKTGWNPQEHADYVETTSLMRPKGGVAVPELHSIRDSIICTPAYPKRWEPYQLKKQRFSWQRKRCKILRTLCCSLCSKCSTL